MLSKSVAKLLLVLAGLLALTVPAAKAAETLVLTCTVCTHVIVTGKGLPASEQVRVSLVDVRSGQEVADQFYVGTDANGAFVKEVPVDLTRHPSLSSTVWKNDGGVLVVAAHSRFTAPCEPKDSLPLTGSNTPLLLGLGAVLLVAGGLMLRGSRRAYRPLH
jgi:LPXTG-motif cell wall-anchored protein